MLTLHACLQLDTQPPFHPHNSGDSSGLVFSPDGTLFALTTPSGVAIHDTASRTLRHALPSPGTLAASFSPDGRFLLTQARPAKDVDQDRNLKLWGVEDGAVRLALHQKHFRREEWPAIRFGVRDALAYYQVTSAVHVYDTSDFSNGERAEVFLVWGGGKSGPRALRLVVDLAVWGSRGAAVQLS